MSEDSALGRRDAIRLGAGAATAAAVGAAGGSAAAQEDGPDAQVIVGPGGDLSYDPDHLEIPPDTTVSFVWESDVHNLNVTSGPDGGWEGYDDLEDTGFEYEHTFEVEGTYEYQCDPHVGGGMEATIVVDADAEVPSGVVPGEDDDDDDGTQQAGLIGTTPMLLVGSLIVALLSPIAFAVFLFTKYDERDAE